ncbi:MAG TPA: creatininase family protein [Candidatus Binatia bacterium]|nr:creatininase family protein [Candidatus Binatia bacterium]
MNVFRLEEMSSEALDRLDRDRTVVILTVSPLEEHGPHLPLGVDAFVGRYFAESVAGRITADRPGWTAVLVPTLHLGTFTFNATGTIRVRQRVVRDAVVDYGRSLARSGFRHILVANGHGGPGHLVALEEASAIVSRRHGVTMASLTGALAWQFLRGGFRERIEQKLSRPLTAAERQAFADDAHGGLWETSIMLCLRPDLVDPGFRDLPPARYPLARRLVPNYPLRDGGRGYVGHPALADPAFATVTSAVLMDVAMGVVDGLLDGAVRPGQHRSPFYRIPLFRTNFWPVAALVAGLGAAGAAAWRRGRTRS